MNILSNRPTSVSRLVWDADMEAKEGYKFKGDILGRISRYCSLTLDSSSGVLCASLPGVFGGSVATSSNPASSKVEGSLDFGSFVSSLCSPVVSSDGSSVYYWDGDAESLDTLGDTLVVTFNLYCSTWTDSASSNSNRYNSYKFETSGRIVLYDKHDLVLETIVLGSELYSFTSKTSNSVENLVRTVFIPYDKLDGVSRIDYSFSTTSSERSVSVSGGMVPITSGYVRSLSMRVPGISVYYSGV